MSNIFFKILFLKILIFKNPLILPSAIFKGEGGVSADRYLGQDQRFLRYKIQVCS